MAEEKKKEEVPLWQQPIVEPPKSATESKGRVTVYSPDTGKEVVIDPMFAAGAGALGGIGLQKTLPLEAPVVRGLPQATIKADVAKETADLTAKAVEEAKTAYVGNLDKLQLEMKAATAELAEANAKLAEARANAVKVGAIVEPTPVPTAPLPGTSTSPGALSEGALSHSAKMGEITQANAVRKGIAGTGAGLPPEARMPLTGYAQNSRLIVPSELAAAPVYNADQQAAQARLQEAQDAYEKAKTNAARVQNQFEKMSTRSAVSPQQAQRVINAQEKAAVAEVTAQKLKAAAPGMMGKVGYALSPALNVVGGAMTAADFANAANAYKQKRYGEAAVNFAGGMGGLIGLAPTLPTRVIGAGLSAIPLAYEGYKAYTGKE